MIVEKETGERADLYEPREDTWLLLSALERFDLAGKRVLDLGTGSGAIALACASMGAEVVAVDLSAAALARAQLDAERKGLTVEFVRCDLLSALSGLFDVIAFNPPYLPSQAISDRAVDGGPGGTALIARFLADLPALLSPEGVALVVLSSLNNPARLFATFPALRFDLERVRSFLFEELMAFAVRRSGPSLK